MTDWDFRNFRYISGAIHDFTKNAKIFSLGPPMEFFRGLKKSKNPMISQKHAFIEFIYLSYLLLNFDEQGIKI